MECLVSIIMIIMTVLALTVFTIMKVTGQDKKKRIWAGVICLLLTPVVFILTGLSVSPFDPSGFGTGMVMMIYGKNGLNGAGKLTRLNC
ncbi:hypothetical protein F0342_09455 [Bacillus sp. CH30_1T]|nr:hypothetical protein F0342_09455 [Bacillus sp. CH30_1T]